MPFEISNISHSNSLCIKWPPACIWSMSCHSEINYKWGELSGTRCAVSWMCRTVLCVIIVLYLYKVDVAFYDDQLCVILIPGFIPSHLIQSTPWRNALSVHGVFHLVPWKNVLSTAPLQGKMRYIRIIIMSIRSILLLRLTTSLMEANFAH